MKQRLLPIAVALLALGVFTALVAGSALRTHYTASALPEPQAWSHVVQTDHRADGMQSCSASAAARPVGTGRTVPSNHSFDKPFRYVWMTRGVPSSRAPLSVMSAWCQLPISFMHKDPHDGAEPLIGAVDLVDRHPPPSFSIIRC